VVDRTAREYAVVWSGPEGDSSGRLIVHPDRFELAGRDATVPVLFSDLTSASIDRTPAQRLRGLPVLFLRRRDGRSLRVASLEGAGVLYELVRLALP